MFLKSVFLTSVILLSYLIFFGQSGFPYEQEWAHIDSLINKKNLPKSALTEVEKLYAAAKKNKEEAQWVKSIIYKAHLQTLDDRDINQSVKDFDYEIITAPPRVAALLKSIEAEALFQFLQGNRFRLIDRTGIFSDTVSSDLNNWTISQFTNKIGQLYLSSLENEDLLKKTKLDILNPVLILGSTRELRPTLYDLLTWRALDYFRVDQTESVSSSYDPLWENPFLFSEAPYFIHYNFQDQDSTSNELIALRLYQKLLRFHAKDVLLDAWIDADVSRIGFVYQNAQMPEKDSMYMNALNRITSQFGTLAISSKAWFLQAKWWFEQGSVYDPLKDSIHRFDFTKAAAVCDQVLKHPDSSEGKWMCEQLLETIRKRSFNLKIEQVNLPDIPFRVLVTYKNIGHLYGRIIRTDDATKESLDQNGDRKIWHQIIQMPIIRNFQQDIPDTHDYQQHRVEFKIEGLKPGQYILLASSDEMFSDSAAMVMTSFFCSNIAFIKKDRDYFVLDRDSGHPLKSLTVKSFIHRYDRAKSVYQPLKIYHTNQQGYFHLTSTKEYSNELKLVFNSGTDSLSNSQYLYYSRSDENDIRAKQKLRNDIFTDRSIYRPGQILYFKGLLTERNLKTGKYQAAIRKSSKIFLLDVNGQKIDSVLLQSNEFGSIHGSFSLPRNSLNGQFTIMDSETENETAISVEEYKRPSFYVKYDTMKGSYKVGDSISVAAFAAAYAGNKMNDAKVTYRVFRESRFPYPWMFRTYPSRSEIQMNHGETLTDRNGKFSIKFIARPDQSVPESAKPIYNYRIEAIVTDLNGESRSATTRVAAGYQSFEIISAVSDKNRMISDSFYFIPVTTLNMSGIFVKEKVTVSITRLTAPSRLIRKRYWEQPDQFVMSEQQYIKFFPHDEYDNESDVKSWKPDKIIYSHTDSTNLNGFFELDKESIKSLIPGWYVIEFTAMDAGNEQITDRKCIEITNNTGKSGYPEYNFVTEEKITGEPGDLIKIQTGSDANDLYVIRLKQTFTDSPARYSFYGLNQNINNTAIDISDKDRGGFGINDIFVKNNRWYTSIHHIIVPWTNKELHFTYLTWRDKTQPGSKLQWKIKIAGNKKDVVAAEVLASMYDASLDQFKNHSWLLPEIYPEYQGGIGWDNTSNFSDNISRMRTDMILTLRSVANHPYDELYNFRGSAIGGRGLPMMSAVGNNMVLMDKNEVKRKESESYKMATSKTVNEERLEEAPNPPHQDIMDEQIDHPIRFRNNFNETAFFKPDLKTDANGDVEINYTMPDALTKWKCMILANTKDLAFGYSEKFVVTQKELMIQTNMPRFFREGDTMLLPIKMANLSLVPLNGTVQLEWIDAGNNVNVDKTLGNIVFTRPFSVEASQSAVVYFPVIIPAHFSQPLLYRIFAKSNMKGFEYGDGEENIIPVLSNRMMITESLPLNMNGKKNKNFVFEKLLKSGQDSSLQNQSLTAEFTTNPVWYAVQSLPYLIEYPYECAEQAFNRFYANALASHILQSSPALLKVFTMWKDADSTMFISNLQKNEELKSVLIRETPWVLQAQSESQQRKNLALLLDMMNMRNSLKSTLDKLRQMQSDDGGFAWFKGGRNDRYITQYIISGIGKLRKLKAIPVELQDPLNKIARAGISFLDREIYLEYEKREKSQVKQYINALQIQYLYMRTFFMDMEFPANMSEVMDYYNKLTAKDWTNQTVYMQGMIALILNRTNDQKTAADILASLRENATHSEELGTYWKSVGYGYGWDEAPVETQSLLMETFSELHADQQMIDNMRVWLLQQKRTSQWPTTKATADACYALLLNGSDWISLQQTVSIQLGSYEISSGEEKTEAGTGYLKRLISGRLVKPDMGNIAVTLNETIPDINHQTSTVITSWGAVYWQYFAYLDKVTPAKTPLSIEKNLYIEKNSAAGPVMQVVSEKNTIKPGDKLKIRIIIKTDRDLEYVHLKDMRAACLEPIQVISGYQWQNGLGFYETTQDASTSFFFDRLPRGTYVFEYPVFATTSGNYSNGISLLECMYAPEFSGHSKGTRINVVLK